MCQNVTIFYRQKLVSSLQVKEKLEIYSNSKLNFSSSCFIADDSHVKIVWLHEAVFSEHDILHFWDNVHLFKYNVVEVSQDCFYLFQLFKLNLYTSFQIFVCAR